MCCNDKHEIVFKLVFSLKHLALFFIKWKSSKDILLKHADFF